MKPLAGITSVAILLCACLATPSKSQDAPPEAVQDKAAARRDAQKALLEMLCLGKRDEAIGARLQKGLSSAEFLGELGRLHVETKKLASELAKLQVSADAESSGVDGARKQAVDALMATLLENSDATDGAFTAQGKAAGDVLAQFRKNLSGMRRGQVVNYLKRAMQSGARYVGQFETLRLLGPDVLDIGLDLLEDPRGLGDRFRADLVTALRDFVREPKMNDAQRGLLLEIVEDEFEAPAVVHNGIGLLAYSGYTQPYDAKIASLTHAAEKATGAEALRQLGVLVHLQSVAERNADATKTYRKILELAKDEKPGVVGTHYYNLACSLEKTGHRDEAIEALDAALERTAKSLARGTLWIDRDIAKIREDARFEKLLEKHELTWPAGLRPKSKGDKDEKSKGDKDEKSKGDKDE